MRIAPLQTHSSARRARDKAELDKIRFDDVLYRARVLVDRGGERVEPRRSAAEFLRQCGEQFFALVAAVALRYVTADAARLIVVFDDVGVEPDPLYQLLGNARSSFETDLTISVNQVDEMVKDALEAVRRGFTTLKIKVGKEGLADIDRVTSIRKAVGNDIQLRVDANQGWTAAQSVAIIKTMEARGLNIQLVEQPVPADDIAGLKYVSGQVDTPILADEAVFSPTDAANLIAIRACDYINIKLMKTGGIWNALKICDLAKRHNVKCMIGCMLESQISVAAAAHLCAGQEIIAMADLDGPSLCASDPFPGGPVFDGPTITMSDDPGVGVQFSTQWA